MREEVKVFEKILIKLGFILNSFNQRYCYEKNRKKPINSYEIVFCSKKHCYSLERDNIGNSYTLKSGNKHLIYETNDHKNMVNFLVKEYGEAEQ